MTETEKDTKKSLTSPISYKFLILIIALAAGYQISLSMGLSADEEFGFSEGIQLVGPAVCAIAAFLTSKRYRGSEVFGKAYLFLAIAFVMYVVGNGIYYYYDFILVDEDAYPYPADGFYFMFYVFALGHLVTNIRYFQRKWSPLIKSWLIALPIVIAITYAGFAAQEWGEYDGLTFDITYSLVFVVAAAVVLAFAVIGAAVFRNSVLGTAWVLLAIGIFLSTFADVWWYYVEIPGLFDSMHPVNTIWAAAFMVIVYALYKHQKVI